MVANRRQADLLHLAGALEPQRWPVRVGGRDLGDMSHEEQAALRRRDVGCVFQRLNLVPSLTAVENVMLALELDGVSVREARSTAIEMLLTVGFDHHLNRFPDDFSGTQPINAPTSSNNAAGWSSNSSVSSGAGVGEGKELLGLRLQSWQIHGVVTSSPQRTHFLAERVDELDVGGAAVAHRG